MLVLFGTNNYINRTRHLWCSQIFKGTSMKNNFNETQYFEGLKRKKEIEEIQLERFHNRILKGLNFNELVDKLILKYDSDEYVMGWYNRGIEPPMRLFDFLCDYAEKYGREATDKEYDEYGNMFTSSIYIINGYYIHIMSGQGSITHIKKLNNGVL